MMQTKKAYFLTDTHFGSRAIPNDVARQRHLVQFLDRIQADADSVYLLGDIFDFWHEWRHVVPRGYTRVLGKLAEMTDRGIKIHLLLGNHDLWQRDYLQMECGVEVHTKPIRIEVLGRSFFLAHGDEFSRERGYRILRAIFHNRLCQLLFASIHPRWAMSFGLNWAKHSRLKHAGQEGILVPREQDELVVQAEQLLHEPNAPEYFIFGHRHVDTDYTLEGNARFIILGDWIEKFSYAVFDGQTLTVEHDKKTAQSPK